jgi:CheY-like chemotaxis protein
VKDVSLHGHRILLVEDEMADARRIDRMLQDAGAEVVGPADTIDFAQQLILDNELSAAWLDVWMDDGNRRVPVWPVANLLTTRGIPFLFCTKVPDDVDREMWPGHPVIGKEIFNERAKRTLVATIADMITKRSSEPPMRLRPT